MSLKNVISQIALAKGVSEVVVRNFLTSELKRRKNILRIQENENKAFAIRENR